MIQDILPQVFRNEFSVEKPTSDSYFLYYRNGKALLKNDNGQLIFPQCSDLESSFPDIYEKCDYLFSINEQKFYLLMDNFENVEFGENYDFYDMNVFRTISPKWAAFALITGSHLYRFYKNNKFCGCCGNLMSKKSDERALECPNCGFIQYPKISPAVIVGIINGDKIVMSKYSQRDYKKYALIAGFMEFGETLEQTVSREVFEEVGLRVKNIQYYDNQPWALSDSLLVGFFAELDGSDEIVVDTKELEAAEWIERSEIPDDNSGISLTQKMIEAFRNNEINAFNCSKIR